MPEDPKVHDGMSPTVKWLIGGVGVGLIAIGATVNSMLKDGTTRDDKVREYLQQEVDKGRTERVDLAKGMHALADATREHTKAVTTQTDLIEKKFDILIGEQRYIPAIREAYKKEARPEQP